MKNFLSRTSSFDFLLPVPQLKKLLAAAVAPELSGFTYNGAYFWYSPWKDHCRKVIQVYPLKGVSYIFLWGLCFDFLPVFGETGSYRYQRTDKSVGLHLFCWPQVIGILHQGRVAPAASAVSDRILAMWNPAFFRLFMRHRDFLTLGF